MATASLASSAELSDVTGGLPVAKALEKDAVCTKCHDESEQRPILTMYKTRHGVKADARTPGCQSCHGASEDHVKNPKGTAIRPLPDRRFVGANKSDPKVINETCIACHKAGSLTKMDGIGHVLMLSPTLLGLGKHTTPGQLLWSGTMSVWLMAHRFY